MIKLVRESPLDLIENLPCIQCAGYAVSGRGSSIDQIFITGGDRIEQIDLVVVGCIHGIQFKCRIGHQLEVASCKILLAARLFLLHPLGELDIGPVFRACGTDFLMILYFIIIDLVSLKAARIDLRRPAAVGVVRIVCSLIRKQHIIL